MWIKVKGEGKSIPFLVYLIRSTSLCVTLRSIYDGIIICDLVWTAIHFVYQTLYLEVAGLVGTELVTKKNILCGLIKFEKWNFTNFGWKQNVPKVLVVLKVWPNFLFSFLSIYFWLKNKIYNFYLIHVECLCIRKKLKISLMWQF